MKNIFFDTDIYSVTSPYGRRTIDGRTELHIGEDWGTGEGTGLFSIRPGGIINNWSDALGGNIITITYNDLKCLFNPTLTGVRFQFHHCQQFIHPTGYHAAAGEVFGLTGRTGRVTGPHVHIEAYEGAHITNTGRIDRVGSAVNPGAYTRNPGIVLKPTPGPVPVDRLPAFLEELKKLIAKYEK